MAWNLVLRQSNCLVGSKTSLSAMQIEVCITSLTCSILAASTSGLSLAAMNFNPEFQEATCSHMASSLGYFSLGILNKKSLVEDKVFAKSSHSAIER